MNVVLITLGTTEAIRFGDRVVQFLASKGRNEVIVKVTSPDEIVMVKKNGTERTIGKTTNTQKLTTATVIKQIAIDSNPRL